MAILLAATDDKVMFEDNVVADLDLKRLCRTFLAENEYDDRRLTDWLHNYITHEPHEISRRYTILTYLAANPQNLKDMRQINQKREELEFSLKEADGTAHPMLLYMYTLIALEAYVSTVDMLLQMFMGSNDPEMNKLYRAIQAEKESHCYQTAVRNLVDMPLKCSPLGNVLLGVNMTEAGQAVQIALTGINESLPESVGLLGGPRENINSLCDDVPLKLRSSIVHLEEYILELVEKELSKPLRHVMKDVRKIESDKLRAWCDWLQPVELYTAGLQYMKTISEQDITYCLPSASKETFEIVDMVYPHMVIRGEKTVSQTLGFSINETVMITGANNSGKTSCLKSLAQNIILAQLGFPALAKVFKFPAYQRIITEFAAGEDHMQLASRYQQEAESLANIVRIADKNTLILLNEPFTSTNPDEASGLISDILIELRKRQSTQIVVTHLYDVYQMSQERGLDDIKSYVIESKVDLGVIFHSYSLEEKIPNGLSYARLLALQYGLDTRKLITDVKTADKISDYLYGGLEDASFV